MAEVTRAMTVNGYWRKKGKPATAERQRSETVVHKNAVQVNIIVNVER